MFDLHFNTTQDVGHGVSIIFICCAMVVLAVLLDLWSGVDAAKAAKERIRSHRLRRTVRKVVDYLRLLMFGVFIDVLGLAMPWYELPYCAIIVTLGVLLIEAKSVIENYHKKHSAAAAIPDMIKELISCDSLDKATELIRTIKDGNPQK